MKLVLTMCIGLQLIVQIVKNLQNCKKYFHKLPKVTHAQCLIQIIVQIKNDDRKYLNEY